MALRTCSVVSSMVWFEMWENTPSLQLEEKNGEGVGAPVEPKVRVKKQWVRIIYPYVQT